MLERMRRAISGWMAYGLIALLVVSFALWGIGDVFSRIGEEPVAEVGGEPIAAERLRARLVQISRLFEQAGARLTPEDIQERGLDMRELQILIAQKALNIESDRLGLVAPDSVIADEIREEPAFRNAFGIFDVDAYRSYLTALGFNEQDYLDDRKHVYARRQMQALINHGIQLPEGLLDHLIERQTARRVLRYAVLPPSLITEEIIADDAEIEQFYRRNPDRFIVPESRSITILLLTPEAILSQEDISQSDLEYEYSVNRAAYLTPATFSGEMLAFTSAEAAAQALARLRSQEVDFAALAKERGLEEEEAVFTAYQQGDFFASALGEAVASATLEEIGGPVETDLGFTLYIVRERNEERLLPLAEVEDVLRRRIALSRGRAEIENLHNLIEDSLAGGASLDEVAAQFSLSAIRRDSLTLGAAAGLGGLPPELQAIPDMAAQIFSALPSDAVLPQTLDNGYYWLEVRDIEPSRILEFSEVVPQAREFVISAKRRAALSSRAQGIAEQVAAGGDFTTLLAPYGRAPLTTPPIGRNFEDEVFSPSMIEGLFSVAPGGIATGVAAVGESFVIAQVLAAPEPPPIDEETLDNLEAQLRASLSEEVIQQYINGVLDEVGSQIYEERVETVLLAPRNPPPGFY